MGSNPAALDKRHSSIGMVNIARKRCLGAACTKRPSFGVAGSKVSEYCKQHAKEGMVSFAGKRCVSEACMKRPCFGVTGSKLSLYCKQHIKEGMVDVTRKRCHGDGCSNIPYFGVAGSKASTYCKHHAKEGMVNLYQKRCLGYSCTKQPSFGTEGSKSALYCKRHAQNGFVNVRTKRCSYGSCTKQSTFSLADSETAGYCKYHAEDGKVNFHKKLTLEGVRITGPARGVPSKAADITCTTRHKNGFLEKPTKSYRSSSEVVNSPKRSMVEPDGVKPPRCVDHSPVKDGEACRNTRINPREADPYMPHSRAPTELRDDDTVGTVMQQSSHRLASTLTSSIDDDQPEHCIKTEMEVAVLF